MASFCCSGSIKVHTQFHTNHNRRNSGLSMIISSCGFHLMELHDMLKIPSTKTNLSAHSILHKLLPIGSVIIFVNCGYRRRHVVLSFHIIHLYPVLSNINIYIHIRSDQFSLNSYFNTSNDKNMLSSLGRQYLWEGHKFGRICRAINSVMPFNSDVINFWPYG